ncbi:Clavaminate synthase-like protein [Crucibulum laeve]|uniref:Clavaminate synthase-like protein n=1 Tax=Crucibulum laeve TaxID=68775 RepID=A0A5C3MGJ1_9AGAR|nr:Clavaminate synthase-like protein [Crucibulum laeve]
MGAQVETLKHLSEEYRELNGTHIEILDEPPSALEFSRLIHKSRPVVIKGYKPVNAANLWTNEYLANKLGEQEISIAVTPNGQADAVTQGPNGQLYFVEPLVEKMTMSAFLSHISEGEYHPATTDVCYLQSQNGNLFSSDYFHGNANDCPSEFEPLRSDILSEITWCSDALGRSPDAVNIWIGDSRSITSIHSDPYENIYTVIRGAKYFTLLPPTDSWSLRERSYPHAIYTRSESTADLQITPSNAPAVRWSSITEPHVPGRLPPEIQPIHVTLYPGDTLYLPVGWWHHVRQAKELTVALNWWYDAEMQGMSWVWLNFLRGSRDVPPGN